MKQVIVKHIYVLSKPVTIDEVYNDTEPANNDDIRYFSTMCGDGNWIHAAYIGKLEYDEEVGFFEDDIKYTHFAYYGKELSQISDDSAPWPSSIFKVADLSHKEEVAFDKKLNKLLNKECFETKKKKYTKARINITRNLMQMDEDDLYEELEYSYNDYFECENTLFRIQNDNAGEIKINLKKLKNCEMDTFVGFAISYQVFDVPEDLFTFNDDNEEYELDAEKFLEHETQRSEAEYCRYCDKHETTGYIAVSNVEVDEDDDDEEEDEDDEE